MTWTEFLNGDIPTYNPDEYPRVAVTVDIVVLTIRQAKLNVLLVKRGAPPFEGKWALPGGFIQPDEDLVDAAARELKEETAISTNTFHLEQLRSYGEPDRDPRMRIVSVAHLAFIPDPGDPVFGSDASDARFWPVDDVHDLAFDHDVILRDGVERARSRLEYTTLATSFLSPPFTMSELRAVYETVWGRPLHSANFRRKVLSTPGFVTRHTSGYGQEPLYPGEGGQLHPPIMRPNGDNDELD